MPALAFARKQALIGDLTLTEKIGITARLVGPKIYAPSSRISVARISAIATGRCQTLFTKKYYDDDKYGEIWDISHIASTDGSFVLGLIGEE